MKQSLLIKIAVGVCALGVFGLLFMRSLDDARTTPYTVEPQHLSRWTLVLEPAHFSRYDELYASERSELFTRRAERDGIRVYSVREDQRCIIAAQP